MSPSAIPKADASLGWPNLPCCPHRHPVSAPCPPSNTWLVLHFCPDCRPEKLLYCFTHRDRHMPALHLVDGPPTQDVQMLRAGERGENDA